MSVEDLLEEEEEGESPFKAQLKAIQEFVKPSNPLTLSDLGDSEIKILTFMKTLGDVVPDSIVTSFVYNYLQLKRSRRRLGSKEIIGVAGGKAWRLLQNITLGKIRRILTSREEEEV